MNIYIYTIYWVIDIYKYRKRVIAYLEDGL